MDLEAAGALMAERSSQVAAVGAMVAAMVECMAGQVKVEVAPVVVLVKVVSKVVVAAQEACADWVVGQQVAAEGGVGSEAEEVAVAVEGTVEDLPHT